jgi:predicted small secreted protein
MAMFRKMWFRCCALMLLAGAGAVLSACNTVHGMGQDIENSADAVRKAL